MLTETETENKSDSMNKITFKAVVDTVVEYSEYDSPDMSECSMGEFKVNNGETIGVVEYNNNVNGLIQVDFGDGRVAMLDQSEWVLV